MRNWVKNNFITGLIFLVPLILTGYIIVMFVSFVDGLIGLLPPKMHPNFYLPYKIPGMGLSITVFVIFLVGVITRSIIGKKIIGLGEKLINQIPMVRSIYQAAKQLAEALFSPRSEGFRRVVMIEYPRRGLYCLGFVTGVTGGEIQVRTHEKVINVFVPTTPNPTSGFYIMVPEKDAYPLTMNVEDAFKLIISGGMVTPPFKGEIPLPISQTYDEPDEEPKQLEKIELRDGEAAAETIESTEEREQRS